MPGHRGKDRAIRTVANSMLQAIWYMFSGREAYRELGANC
ncbi:hypothetical protein SBA3_450036 [Candidatus Sulfopaludibacter sp. SbA3]|nr:hypothetical protein SBA3_450036 [Candidatus Sulfopaludibacter sp. SbA3]